MKTTSALALSAVAAMCCAAPVQALEEKIDISLGHTEFSRGAGKRDLQQIEYMRKDGPNTLVLNASTAQRHYGGSERFAGRAISGALYHRWSKTVTTRTQVAYSSDDPVFAARILDQNVTYSGLDSTALTFGVRHARYFGDVDSKAWYASGAYYMDRLSMRYRYTKHETDGLGDTSSHVVSLHLKDTSGRGNTQLWLSRGDSIHEYLWTPELLQGSRQGISVRRVQPLNFATSLHATLERATYETPLRNYHGISASLGLAYRW